MKKKKKKKQQRRLLEAAARRAVEDIYGINLLYGDIEAIVCGKIGFDLTDGTAITTEPISDAEKLRLIYNINKRIGEITGPWTKTFGPYHLIAASHLPHRRVMEREEPRRE